MKKFLLTMLAVVFSTAMFAQQRSMSELQKVNVAQTQKISLVPASKFSESTESGQVRAQKRDRDNPPSLYFTKPSGSMYYKYDEDGYGYYPNLLYIPALMDYKFTNKYSDPLSCHWWVGDYEYEADEDGNFWWGVYPSDQYFWYCPELWNSNNTVGYWIPSYYYDEMGYGDGYQTLIVNTTYLSYYGFYSNYWNYGYSSSTSNYNLMGTCSFNYSDGSSYKCKTIVQDLPEPVSPLYFEKVYIYGRSLGGKPITNADEMAMEVYDSNTNELLMTLTATNDDWIEWADGDRGYGGGKFGILGFTLKEEDPLFGTTIAPVTFDRAVTLVIDGFDGDAYDFGVCMNEAFDCDPELIDAYAVAINVDDASDVRYPYYSDAGLNMIFVGLMDMALVADELSWTDGYGNSIGTYSGYNTLIFSDDGKTAKNDVSDEDFDLGCIFAEIATPWYDEDNSSIENYYIEGLPDWVTGYSVDTEDYDINYYSCVVYIEFTAEALPSGTDYRNATVYLHGRGMKAETPIYLLQGNIPEGIESVHAAETSTSKSARTFNLAGQRVSDSAKGILVRDGKKFINK